MRKERNNEEKRREGYFMFMDSTVYHTLKRAMLIHDSVTFEKDT